MIVVRGKSVDGGKNGDGGTELRRLFYNLMDRP